MPGVQVRLYFSQSQDEVLHLILGKFSTAAAVHKSLLQSIHRNLQALFMVPELRMQIPEHFLFFHHFVQGQLSRNS